MSVSPCLAFLLDTLWLDSDVPMYQLGIALVIVVANSVGKILNASCYVMIAACSQSQAFALDLMLVPVSMCHEDADTVAMC